jgi:hypothetical protein
MDDKDTKQAQAPPAKPAAQPKPAQNRPPTQAQQPARPAVVRPAAPRPSGPSLGTITGSVASDPDARLLRLNPEGKRDRQDLSVTVGEEFVTEVSLSNKKLVPFDQVRVFLSYPPDFMEPVSINDKVLAPFLQGNPTAEVDPMYGIILYEAVLERPLAVNDSPILSVRWKANKVNTDAPIEFSSRDNAYTTLMSGDVDLLGSPRDPRDGTLSMRVSILPEDPREAQALLTDPRTYDSSQEKVGGVRMFLKPQAEPIIVGEPFYIDVILDNRAFSMLDGLGVLLNYDPQVLEVLDADYNNWITLNTNIHDGPYRDIFPWNYHIENAVYNRQGLVSYRVGTDDAEMSRGKIGPIARLYAVAKVPTAATKIVFKFDENPRRIGTEATFVGTDCMGDPEVFADGAQGLVLMVNAQRNKSPELAADSSE